jgi:hypothetical protein
MRVGPSRGSNSHGRNRIPPATENANGKLLAQKIAAGQPTQPRSIIGLQYRLPVRIVGVNSRTPH